jgi:hypothetical protein
LGAEKKNKTGGIKEQIRRMTASHLPLLPAMPYPHPIANGSPSRPGLRLRQYTAPMFRRWFIRSLALALLTLCVTAWVGSYWRLIEMERWDRHRIICQGQWGEICLYCEDKRRTAPLEVTWRCYSSEPLLIQAIYGSTPHHFAGFAFERFSGNYWHVFIPLWFPTLVSALLLWFVWRKTRAKVVGGAFPVELAKAEVK